MENNYYAVIMAGGVGERFWPISRNYRPKQFLDILGTGKTLLQQTYDRFLQVCPKENIFITTNRNFLDLVQEQLQGIDPSRIICEPTRKNTAPCIAYAAYKIHSINPDAMLVVAPSDHIILKEEEFTRAMLNALDAASRKPWLFTLGITPSRPDIGYGYIQYLDGQVLEGDDTLRKVKTFTEKPDLDMAVSFLESGDFLWNSGIFIWSCHVIMDAFERYQPEISYVFREALGKYNTAEEILYMDTAYATCKSISIDYAIMELADNVYVYIADFGWSDLGTWSSLYDVRPKDQQQNAVMGRNVLLYDTSDCIVNIPEDKLVVIQGLDGYIVAESDNALLICRKSEEHQLRKIVSDIKLKKGVAFI